MTFDAMKFLMVYNSDITHIWDCLDHAPNVNRTSNHQEVGSVRMPSRTCTCCSICGTSAPANQRKILATLKTGTQNEQLSVSTRGGFGSAPRYWVPIMPEPKGYDARRHAAFDFNPAYLSLCVDSGKPKDKFDMVLNCLLLGLRGVELILRIWSLIREEKREPEWKDEDIWVQD